MNVERYQYEIQKMNWSSKKLSSLGGDDTIYVVLDDRHDVWNDAKSGGPIQNLIQVSPYFFFEDKDNPMYNRHEWYAVNIRDVMRKFDFDICLAVQV